MLDSAHQSTTGFAEVIAFWMNGHLPTGKVLSRVLPASKASRVRVAKLVGHLQEADRLSEEIARTALPDPDQVNELGGKVKAEIAEANKLLQQYPHFYQASFQKTEVAPRLVLEPWPARFKIPLAEVLVIQWIQSLISQDLFWTLRLCVCGKYFQAIRADQRSCSAKCRHRLYEQTDEAKEKRRDYMRGYYKLKKTGKVK